MLCPIAGVDRFHRSLSSTHYSDLSTLRSCLRQMQRLCRKGSCR